MESQVQINYLRSVLKLPALLVILLVLVLNLFGVEEKAGKDWWSLQPIKKIIPPNVGRTEWAKNKIDHFILDKLVEQNLKPSSTANPRAQIRRLYYDLIGLPPNPKQISNFESNPSDEAYREIVEELLSSKHYGERWGRHWLDIARFGESDGFERNNPRNNLWPFRDWVIKALNNDMPYDEFVRMQIAGDIIKPGKEGTAAVAFLAAGLHNTVVGGSEFMKKTARQDELEEITGAVGQTFFGLTVNCARCHDHKYDPILQKEYYQLTSALKGVFHGENDVQDSESVEKIDRLKKEINSLHERVEVIESLARSKAIKKRETEPKASQNEGPLPISRWEFDQNFNDSIGTMNGIISGKAKLENGALVLNGQDSFVTTAPLEKDIHEKSKSLH